MTLIQESSTAPPDGVVGRVKVVGGVLLLAAVAAALAYGMQLGLPTPSAGAAPPPSLASTATNMKDEAQTFLRHYKIAPLSGDLHALLTRTAKTERPTQPHPLLGQVAPSIALNDVHDRPHTLESALAKGPVVVVFYYGYGCNHCVAQLFDLQEDLRYFRELGVEIIAVSPDATHETRQKYAEYGKFDFTVLSDPDNRVAEMYGAFTRGRDQVKDAPRHGTFVLSRDGRVEWAYLGGSPFGDNATLLHVLARLEDREPPSTETASVESAAVVASSEHAKGAE